MISSVPGKCLTLHDKSLYLLGGMPSKRVMASPCALRSTQGPRDKVLSLGYGQILKIVSKPSDPLSIALDADIVSWLPPPVITGSLMISLQAEFYHQV